MATVIAVCQSEKKGTKKTPMPEVILQEEFGVVGDAHADCQTHRQVSLLAIESIEKMRRMGFVLQPGDFAENITTTGIELTSLPIGTIFNIGDEVVLEMTQIGKECHAACAVRKQVGDCIMPREGIFARVIRGGQLRAGDAIVAETGSQE
ncbi:MAG: MOSC domain-containing protein [Chloroflexota bacterium]